LSLFFLAFAQAVINPLTQRYGNTAPIYLDYSDQAQINSIIPPQSRVFIQQYLPFGHIFRLMFPQYQFSRRMAVMSLSDLALADTDYVITFASTADQYPTPLLELIYQNTAKNYAIFRVKTHSAPNLNFAVSEHDYIGGNYIFDSTNLNQIPVSSYILAAFDQCQFYGTGEQFLALIQTKIAQDRNGQFSPTWIFVFEREPEIVLDSAVNQCAVGTTKIYEPLVVN
jgi:hypothetical protein